MPVVLISSSAPAFGPEVSFTPNRNVSEPPSPASAARYGIHSARPPEPSSPKPSSACSWRAACIAAPPRANPEAF